MGSCGLGEGRGHREKSERGVVPSLIEDREAPCELWNSEESGEQGSVHSGCTMDAFRNLGSTPNHQAFCSHTSAASWSFLAPGRLDYRINSSSPWLDYGESSLFFFRSKQSIIKIFSPFLLPLFFALVPRQLLWGSDTS